MSEKKEETKKTIYAQFRAAQAGFAPVKKDAVNPFFNSRYASLSSILDAVSDALNNEGLSLSQSVENGEILTILRNDEGEQIVSKRPFVIPKVVKEVGKGNFILVEESDPQAIGKAETYARRYGLQLALGLTAEDDDAESAESHQTKPAHQAKPAYPPKPAAKPAQQQAKPAKPQQEQAKPAPAKETAEVKEMTLDEVRCVEGVIVEEDEGEVYISGKTYAISKELKHLGFAWNPTQKRWEK